MNCREYRELIDDALDTSLNGVLGRRVKLHLNHCTACSDYCKRRQKEHVALFAAMNAAYADQHLPPGFVDSVIAEIALEEARRKRPFFVRMPRWALIAASLVAMVGFAFAAAIMGGRVIRSAPDLAGGDEPIAQGETEATEGTEEMSAALAADSPSVTSDPDVISVSTTSSTKGDSTMTRKKAATAALTAAMAAAPLAAANGDDYQFIVSGDIVSATEGCSALSSDATSLTSGTLAKGFVYESSLEARCRTMNESAACSLRSDKAGFMISLR